MPELFQYHPHPRIAEHTAAGPTRVVDQRRLDHPNPVVRFNARFGLLITVAVGTMWCAYIFACIALISLPDNIHSTQTLILQLVLLPIIIVGQNIQAKTSDKRAEETYRDAEAVLHEATQIQAHLAAQDQAIGQILDRLGRTGPT